jgi:hypothetical protein
MHSTKGSKTTHKKGMAFATIPRFAPMHRSGNAFGIGDINPTKDKGPGEYLGQVQQFTGNKYIFEAKDGTSTSQRPLFRGGFVASSIVPERSKPKNKQTKLRTCSTGYPHYQMYVVEKGVFG